MAILILGGGVPKNYSLQPEPTLSQIFMLEGIKGYDYDFQIVSSPVTDGSLSGCFASEAVTWGKVNPGKIHQTASLQADYSTVMPFIVRALVEKFPKIPPLRLFNRREELMGVLDAAVNKRARYLKEKTFSFPLVVL
ncbi:MAG: deoxyhypusine synthase family protein [Candidatus Yonathbacteria bacterium]|nr:deoxyhypusine synthase family protein [Candidatus Yonathbacteria bacterium]